MNNPTRRNRNIGTAKQGHGQDNKMVIPDAWWDSRVFYEKLVNPVKVERTVHGRTRTFLIEPTLNDYTHCCTVDDICEVLKYVPREDMTGLDIIVLRQPKRKEKILSSVWGRLCFYYEPGSIEGPAIILESIPLQKPHSWSKSLDPEWQQELKRLEEAGHKVTYGRRSIEIGWSLESCRWTQLYHTIPHEVGHYVDYLRYRDKDDFHDKNRREKEDYAHRYADEFREKLTERRKLPFERKFDEKKLKEERLDPDWFLDSRE